MELTFVVAALAKLENAALFRMIEAGINVPQTAPGLLAWIEIACDWELNKRQRLDYPLQPPQAAIPPEVDAVSIDAAMIIRAQFAQDGHGKITGAWISMGFGQCFPVCERQRPLQIRSNAVLSLTQSISTEV